MRTYRLLRTLFSLGVTYIKKLLAVLILLTARFINTNPGRYTLLTILLAVIGSMLYFEHIAFFPLVIRVVSAGVRRSIMFAMIMMLTPRTKFWVRMQMKLIRSVCIRKWGAMTLWKRITIQLVSATVVGALLLDYLHMTHIAMQVIALVPIPVVVSVYATETIPSILIAFAERQGVGVLVYDGGWHLLPPKPRKWLRTKILRLEEYAIAKRLWAIQRAKEKARKRAALKAAQKSKRASE